MVCVSLRDHTHIHGCIVVEILHDAVVGILLLAVVTFIEDHQSDFPNLHKFHRIINSTFLLKTLCLSKKFLEETGLLLRVRTF